MVDVKLTYCGNVHPATDPDSWIAAVGDCSVPVARVWQAQGRPFGLGAWWNASTAEVLATDTAVQGRVRSFLEDHGLEIWTLNAFPFGTFHEATVKASVYQPDWGVEDRLQYTRHAAAAVAALRAPGAEVPLSTLPLGYRRDGASPPELRKMARNLARAASAMAALEERTGVRVVVALEPEPFCLVETAAQAAEFLERWLFAEGAWTVPEDVLRRHLGVCVDLCHLAVVGEDPLAAIADLGARGIAVPKIQVSSCLEVRDPTGLDRLLTFDEPVYLHQTVAAPDGPRALDLPDVRARRAEFAAAGRLRTHFHMPLYWDEEGPFGSTRTEVIRVLHGLPRPWPVLEVETYTWDVLPAALRADALPALLAKELDFAAKHLGI